MSAEESLTLESIDIKNWLHYLEVICEVFRGEIPHVKHPKLDYAEFKQNTKTANTMADFARLHRIAAAKREAAKEENGASHVNTGGRRSQKLVIADKIPSKFLTHFKACSKVHVLTFWFFNCFSIAVTTKRRAPPRPETTKLRKIRKHCKFFQIKILQSSRTILNSPKSSTLNPVSCSSSNCVSKIVKNFVTTFFCCFSGF